MLSRKQTQPGHAPNRFFVKAFRRGPGIIPSGRSPLQLDRPAGKYSGYRLPKIKAQPHEHTDRFVHFVVDKVR